MTDSDVAPEGPDTFIKNATTNSLISYVATFRALRINKQNAIRCMQELDKRRQNGEDVPYEELIQGQAEIYKSVGKGLVVKILPTADIEQVLESINALEINAAIFNKDRGLIHIGKPSTDIQTQISSVPGVQKIVPDQSELINAASSKILGLG